MENISLDLEAEAGTAEAERQPMSPGLVLLMAIASGLAAANLYYCQPILVHIARGLNVTEKEVGILPTLAQIGYATGLLFITPLGDVLPRRRLIVTLFGIVTVILGICAAAPSLLVLMLGTFAIGVTTVMAQILLPFAVHLSPPGSRGKVVGSIMSGLLVGILLSRTVSGYVGELWGWRVMYALAAAVMVIMGVTLRLQLPEGRPTASMAYPALLKSIFGLVRELPVLREAALSGALIFGSFCAFWTAIAFLLASPAYHLGSHVAGLFGIVGAAGALVAPMVGKYGDKRHPRFLIGRGVALMVFSYILLGVLGTKMWGLILGVLALDLATQTAHIANQTRVYGLLPDAHSRLNTVYMSSYFFGGACGSYLGALGWTMAGWAGVCAAGGGLASLALVLHLLTRRNSGRTEIPSSESLTAARAEG